MATCSKKVIDGNVAADQVVTSYNATQFLIGEFSGNVGGAEWTIKFDGKEGVTLHRNDTRVVQSTYRVRGDKIRFSDVGGPKAVKEPGTYEWKLAEGILSFKAVDDPSSGRKMILSSVT